MGSKQKKIIFVPGKNCKPEPELHHQMLSRSLIEGVTRHSPLAAEEILQQQAFTLSAWNYDFYHEHLDFSDQLHCLDNLLRRTHASMRDRVCARTWKIRLSRMLYQTADRFPQLIDWFADEHVKALLNGTNRYFNNIDGKADQARATLKDCLQQANKGSDDCQILLIGHSMGSIIAYDTLFELSQQGGKKKQVDLFLSLGSPLGLRYTQERLLAFSQEDSKQLPNNIVEWKNVAAHGDLVSVDTTLADDFSLMVKQGLVDNISDYTKGVYNWYRGPQGYNFHSSYAYLVGPVVSDIIARWWLKTD